MTERLKILFEKAMTDAEFTNDMIENGEGDALSSKVLKDEIGKHLVVALYRGWKIGMKRAAGNNE